ncbi:MAG: hypothetical protein IID18_08055 [Nitrospinae bacterium]|nr:hypothetical protein [Nitrospinota bacterium]
MNELINKNGLGIGTSSNEVFEEVMRGTGFVMAKNVAFFLEKVSLDEKFIVVSKCPDSKKPEERVKFPSGQFKEAFELFVRWRDSG